MSTPITFAYVNAAGTASERRLTEWAEVGFYLQGFDEAAQAIRTFRKDRITAYHDGAEALLADPFPGPPPSLSRSRAGQQSGNPAAAEILFTGFAAQARRDLEAAATAEGLKVVKSVTQHLVFLVAGPNAGPAKSEQARAQGVYIVSEPEFMILLETGELPDHAIG